MYNFIPFLEAEFVFLLVFWRGQVQNFRTHVAYLQHTRNDATIFSKNATQLLLQPF